MLKQKIRLFSKSISLRVFLCVAFSAIIIVFFFGLNLLSNRLYERSFTDQAITYNLNYAAQLSKTISSMFSKIDLDFREISRNQEVQAMVLEDQPKEKYKEAVKKLYFQLTATDNSLYDSLCNISVYSVRGQVHQYGTIQTHILNMMASDYYAQALSQPASLKWLGLNQEYGTYEAVKMIYDADYRVQGVIVLSFDSDFLKKLLSGSTFTGLSDFYLFDENGSRLYWDRQTSFQLENAQGLISQMNSGQGYFYTDGRLILYRNLSGESNVTFSMPEWYIVFLNTDQKIDEASSEVQRKILIWCAVLGGLAVLLIVEISLLITKPIKNLSDFMDGVVTKQDFKSGPPEKFSFFREINQFAKSFRFMVEKTAKLIDDSVEEKIRKRQIQSKMLNMQITPHFIYNALQVVSLQAYETGNKEICDMISDLTYILTSNIRGSQNEVTVKEELRYVSAYLSIIQARYEGKITWELDDPGDAGDYLIPKFMLQIFVENAVVHGLVPKAGKGRLTVKIQKVSGKVQFEVRDDGVGMLPERLKELRNGYLKGEFELKDVQDNIGVNNVYYRLKMRYGDCFQFSIQSLYHMGTQIMVELPDDKKELPAEKAGEKQ